MNRLVLAAALLAACGGKKGDDSSEPNVGSASPVSDYVYKQLKDAPPGLDLKVSEGKAGPPAFDRNKLAPATKLGDGDATAILSRAKPITKDADDQKDFALRPRSQPVPRTGNTITAQFPRREIRVTSETNHMNLKCVADPYRLQQVFRNLLENAVAACPDPLELKVHWSQVLLGGQPALRCALNDNGPGLSIEVQERMFEPFFTTKSKGTGLGMSIAKRIVEAHGGRIVATNGSVGAEFVITLPRKLTEWPSEVPDASPQP